MAVLKLKTTPEQWIMYVADKEYKQLFKFKYDHTTGTITYLNSLRENLDKPVDISLIPFSQIGGINGEHKIFVADAGVGGFLYVDQNNTLLGKITSYTYSGTTYPLNNIVKIICKPDLYVVVIDGNQNAVVTFHWNDIPQAPTTNNTANATSFVKFEPASIMNSIGYGNNFNYYSDFYATDKGLNMVHKFSFDGMYIASFSSFSSSSAVDPNKFIGRNNIFLFNDPLTGC